MPTKEFLNSDTDVYQIILEFDNLYIPQHNRSIVKDLVDILASLNSKFSIVENRDDKDIAIIEYSNYKYYFIIWKKEGLVGQTTFSRRERYAKTL